jgi:hypothetical protein
LGRSLRSVEEVFEALEMEGKEVGFKINEQKAKVLKNLRKEDTQNGKLLSGMLNWKLPTWILFSRTKMRSWKKYRQPTGLTSPSCH